MNRTSLTRLLTLAALMALGAPALAQVSPDETDAAKVMAAVEGKAEGDNAKGRMTMTITDAAGRERTRELASRTLQFKEGTKQIMVFKSPADVAGTGLLSIDYDDGAKDDDQWLYMPSLHKSTRISSGSKSGSFMGSDLSYADMTRADPTHYDYTMLGQAVDVEGEAAWHIEARPKTEKTKKETGYVKTEIWISKAKLTPLRLKAWVKEGKRIKLIAFQNIKQVDAFWVPHTIVARTQRGKKVESTTVLQFAEISYGNADVNADLFSEGQLEKGL